MGSGSLVVKLGIITLFPEMFLSIEEHGITARAYKNKLLEISYFNPRDYTQNKHRRVDDRPFGGGPGMVMRVEPLVGALTAVKMNMNASAPLIYLSPQGIPLTQKHICALAKQSEMVLLCGRYEGIDQRFIDHYVDESYSIGDYVLSGGELAAMVLIDAMTRWLPGALGDDQSVLEDSFADRLCLDHPHYTRPPNREEGAVPEVLLSGDHQAIARWRLQQRLCRTYRLRPDLFATLSLTEDEQKLLEEGLKNEN